MPAGYMGTQVFPLVSSRPSLMSWVAPGHFPGDLYFNGDFCNFSRARTEGQPAPVPSFVCETPRDLAVLPDRYSLSWLLFGALLRFML